MSKYNDDDYEDELEDEDLDDEDDSLDDDGPTSAPFGSGQPRTSGLGGGLSGSNFGPRPSGLVGGPSAGGSSGSRPNLPGSPGSGNPQSGGFTGSRPNLPGSPGSGNPQSGSFGGSRPNLPGSPGSGNPQSGGFSGSRPNLPGSPGSGNPQSGGFSGSRPNLPGSPGSGNPQSGGLSGSRPNLPGSPGSGSPQGGRPPSQSSSGVRPADSGKSENKGPLGGIGGFRPFGGGSDKNDSPRKENQSGGNPLGGLASKLPFGGGGDKKAAPRTDKKTAGSGLLGGLTNRLPFGKKQEPRPPARPSGGYGTSAGGQGSGGALGGGARPFVGGSAQAPAAPTAGGMKAAKAERTRRFELPFGLGGVFGKKDAKTTRTRASKAPRVEQGGLSLDTKLDIIGLALVVVAAALLLASLSPNQGAITGEINRFLSYLFGWGAIAIPFSMLAAGIWLLIRHFGEDAPTLPVQQVIGLAILYVTIITIMQFVKAFEYPPDALQSGLLPQFIELSSTLGQGGGYIGGQLYTLLITLAGEWAGFALLLIPLAVGLMLSVQLGFAELALVFISSLRNMRDQARTRAVRREAELAKRQEQRALAAQSAPQVAATSRPTEALPAGTRPALAPPPQSPVPVQLPLGASAEPRSIPITQGGRTITASFDTEADESELPVPVRPAASFAQAPAPEKPEAAARGGGLGRLIPGAVAGAAAAGAAAAFKALTPTEEADEFEPHDTVRRGLGGLRLPSLPGKKPDADKSPPAQPGANKPGGILSGLGQRRPDAAAPATPPTPAAAAPKPPIDTAPPAPTLSPAAPVQTPAPPPQTGQADDQQPAPRMGDLLRAGGSGLAAPARPSASDTEVGLKPASAGAGGSSLPGPRSFTPPAPPRAAPPLDIEADEDEDDDDLLAMKPAQPKGLGVAPRPASDTPFGPPRVMPVRGDSAATPEKPGEDAKRPQPAASVTPVGSWQDRMKALQGSLPGSDDGDKDKPADKPAAGSGSAAGSPLTPRPFSAGSDTQRQPPRIIKMDEDNQDIDDEDEDDLESLETASDAVKPAPMKPLSQPARPAAPTTGQPPGERPSPFAPRAPLTASSAFKRPETPPSIVRAPSPPAQTPPPPQQPAASISGSAANPPRVVTPAPTAPPAATAPPASAGEPPAAPRTGRREWKIPELSAVLASGMDQELDHALLLQRAKTIEETLESFGAPGRVVEVRTGPVITQFGVEPDYLTVRGGKKVRVKVSNIAQLDKDLQLALGAKSIRIEAPVPGKGYVGIEVPNEQASIVRLRDVMESEQFRKIKSPLAIALGQGVDGTPICADLTSMPHLLIAGTTGSGKSVCVNSIIGSLLLNNTPERLRFIMVDPKRVELTAYNGIPHLVSPVVVELERIVGVLKWVTREMDERYRRFSAAGARNIEDYNKHIPSGDQFMPYIIVIIDELADLMMLAPEETERVVTRLAALARATGIHLVIATQRPSVDVVTGLIKANFPARIAFAVAGSVDSRVILDQPGAERLLGRGDMLYMSGDSPAPQRLQGVFVSDTEINNITRSWRQQFDESTPGKLTITQFALDEMVKDSGSGGARSMGGGLGSGQPLRQQALWDRESGPTSYVSTRDPDSDDDGDIGEDGEDEMYEESVKLVRTLKKASVSLLQRRLRIGYTRAARLIDLMEERGVVGPAQSGSTPREVIG